MPADLGYHSLTPRYHNQSAYTCDILPGGRCYYDGSGLNSEPVYERLVREGGEAVWDALEQFYRETFAGEPSEEGS